MSWTRCLTTDDENVWPQEMLITLLSLWYFLWQYIKYLLKSQRPWFLESGISLDSEVWESAFKVILIYNQV